MQSHRAVFLNTAAVFAVQTRTDRDELLNTLPCRTSTATW